MTQPAYTPKIGILQGVDTSNMIDITVVGDAYVVMYDPVMRKVYSGDPLKQSGVTGEANEHIQQ